MDVEPKIGVGSPQKWMVYSLFHGKPYEQMDDLGEKKTYFWKHPYMEHGNMKLHRFFVACCMLAFNLFLSISWVSGPCLKNLGCFNVFDCLSTT